MTMPSASLVMLSRITPFDAETSVASSPVPGVKRSAPNENPAGGAVSVIVTVPSEFTVNA